LRHRHSVDKESAFLTARKLFNGFIVAVSPCCGAIDVGTGNSAGRTVNPRILL
jgi:hypothetical protein